MNSYSGNNRACAPGGNMLIQQMVVKQALMTEPPSFHFELFQIKFFHLFLGINNLPYFEMILAVSGCDTHCSTLCFVGSWTHWSSNSSVWRCTSLFVSVCLCLSLFVSEFPRCHCTFNSSPCVSGWANVSGTGARCESETEILPCLALQHLIPSPLCWSPAI